MPGAETGQIGIHFPGLIQLLAKNLYPQEDMFLRELIQNAHDSIIKRQADEKSHVGRIDIRSDRQAMTIVIEDNGAGMTRDEIVMYLATIGRSGTGELREMLEARGWEGAQSLIGQFGIGLMSAFVVAERIVVETHSVRGKEPALRWTVAGGPDYTLEEMKKPETGTRVTLHLKEGYSSMTDTELLRKTVRRYADFLPFPIHVNGGPPANSMQAPWHRTYASEKEKRQAYFDWVDDRFPDFPLEIIPVELTGEYPAQGVLYISDRHIPDVNTAGRVDIYQARMFIREGDRNLLPGWAKFIAGVIDSPALKPTAARDAIQEDEAHSTIRTALGQLVLDALIAMSRKDPERFARLMEWHHYHIKGMAVEFPDFFAAIADVVPFEVNEMEADGFTPRQLTLPEYTGRQTRTDAKDRKYIYYINEKGAAPQFFRLCAAQGILALNASYIFEERFLEQYANGHEDTLALERVNLEDNAAIFTPLAEEERTEYARLEYRLKNLFGGILPGQQTEVRTERFKPTDIPAVLTQSRERESLNKLEEMTRHPGVQSDLMRDFLKEIMGIQQQRVPPIVLHLNADCPLIARLSQEDFSENEVRDAWLTIYNSAAVSSQHFLSPQNQEALQRQNIQSLHRLLELRQERRELQAQIATLQQERPVQQSPLPTTRTPHVSLFCIMPYKEPYSDDLEQALRLVFEDDPYYFQVILDRDATHENNLFENLRSNMRLVHGFIADISDHNPNVMIELGITQADNEARPTLVLRRSDGKETPGDIRGWLYISYDLPPASPHRAEDLAKQLRKQFAKQIPIIEMLKGRESRYLSSTYLRQRADAVNWTDDRLRKLHSAYTTVEAITGKDAETIRQATDLDSVTAVAIAEAFRKATSV